VALEVAVLELDERAIRTVFGEPDLDLAGSPVVCFRASTAG
jgi:hypothetical protein